jgi:tetratricopeptide (TPR) repeat protein
MRWLPLIIICCVVPGAAARGDEDDELLETQEKMADLLEGKDDLRGAYKIWREVLSQHPRSATALDNASRLALELKRHKEALDPARRLVQLDAGNPRHRARLVAALLANNLQAEAVPHLQWLQQRAPADVEVRKELAAAYHEAKRWTDALVHYDWLVARFPRDVEHRLARAALYGDMNQESRQRAEVQQLIKLLGPSDKRFAEVHFQLGELYYHDEDYARAEASLDAALRAAPRHAGARALLAKLRAAREAASRRARREQREAEQYQDWLLDIQERAEDF